MRFTRTFQLILIALVFLTPYAAYAVRIKDIASIQGVRRNQLLGYGLVVGLDGTGDDDKTEFTIQSVASMLEKMGIVVNPEDVDIDNVAGVMVTANLPAFAKVGTRIDVVVSSIGNAESLQGGTLLMTPLKAPDGEVYAVAQGPISIGGFAFAGAAGGGVQKNHPTVGQIPGGAIIEKEVKFDLSKKTSLEISLRQPDFTTCLRMAKAIQESIGSGMAEPLDAGTVSVKIPESYNNNMVAFISNIEKLEIMPDITAKVVVNERTGTVVIGDNVRISTVAVSHGNLSIVIKEQPAVSQPLPFSAGETVVVPQTEVQIQEQISKLILVPEGASIGDVIRGLNAIGVTPRDLIAILQAIRAAGALQAELEII
jgi:flagellar P-ring protein precursor FlgI